MSSPGASRFAIAALAAAILTLPAGAQDAPDGKPVQFLIPMGQFDRVGLCMAGRMPAVEKASDPEATGQGAKAGEKASPDKKNLQATGVNEELLKRYDDMLNQLRAELTAKIPQASPAQREAFAAATKAVVAASGQVGEAAKVKDPKARDEKVKAAQEALVQAKARLNEVFAGLKMGQFLTNDALDARLVKYVVLLEATPRGLAEFAQQGEEHAKLADRLLEDAGLMKQMVVADGANAVREGRIGGPARYGQAMKIYTDIQKASSRAADGVLQRLALAIALEHAVPVPQSNPKAATDAPATIDPVRRYLHYEKAFLGGELDPGFNVLTVWDLRLVVYGEEPDEALAWGREMLRNYRPDHISTPDYGWRYVRIVGTDVKYGSGDVKHDRPELQNYQNILMNGGVCGRRAFFGRFILRAFGIPTTARPQSGHAALVHWTPNGWVPCLGGGWGSGWTPTRYNRDLDFLATTQARVDSKAFLQVKRAQWFGDVLGEKRIYGEHDGPPDFWNGVASYTQRVIIEEAKAAALGAVGEDLGEANESKVKKKPEASTVTPEDRKITCGADGVISIPAAAYSNPSGNTPEVFAINSFGGGMQVFLPRFFREGTTMLRGGTWKSDAPGCTSGTRLLSGGYGAYDNWGLRVALTPTGSEPARELALDLGNGVKMDLVYIKPGSFSMGGESTTEGRFQCVEVPKHEVTLTRGFYLGKYEVTQAQYEAIMGANPSRSTKAPDCPVDNVSMEDALKFCENLAEKTRRDVRLPTEAEWEYACRAGTDTTWFFGNEPSSIGDYGWFKDNAVGKSHPVGQKKPNAWGLYDMCGNVCERISDIYAKDYYAKSPKVDPTGPSGRRKSCFEYRITAPRAGTYSLSARVVTVNYEQQLIVSANGAAPEVTLVMPFTCGKWKESDPVTLKLKEGENVLCFSRDNPPQSGMSIQSFTLKPVP